MLAAAACVPDDRQMLAVHRHVVAHGGVVGEREVEHDLKGVVMNGGVVGTGWLWGEMGREVTFVQLTPIKLEEELEREQSALRHASHACVTCHLLSYACVTCHTHASNTKHDFTCCSSLRWGWRN